MRKASLLVLFLSLMLSQGHPVNGHDLSHVVLVTADESGLPVLTLPELRKLYLGVALIKNDLQLEPVLNQTDSELYEEFLQKVLFMSARHYQRQQLSRVFRLGGRRTPVFTSTQELMSTLNAATSRVTYMREKTARETDGIIVLQRLW